MYTAAALNSLGEEVHARRGVYVWRAGYHNNYGPLDVKDLICWIWKSLFMLYVYNKTKTL